MTIRKTKAGMTADYMRTLISYDPESGALIWIKGPNAGQSAGRAYGTRYHHVHVSGRTYSGHMIAYLLMTGEWPTQHLDHINRDPSDNRWSNLRLASAAENARNRSIRSDSLTGVKGVGYNRRDRVFQALIMVDGKHIKIGNFQTVKDAAAAYRAAAEQHHGEFSAHNHTAEVLSACPSLEWFGEQYPADNPSPRKARSDKGVKRPRAQPDVSNRNLYGQSTIMVGVKRHKPTGRFVAVLGPDQVTWHDTAEEAARAYDRHARLHGGPDARTNVSEGLLLPLAGDLH